MCAILPLDVVPLLSTIPSYEWYQKLGCYIVFWCKTNVLDCFFLCCNRSALISCYISWRAMAISRDRQYDLCQYDLHRWVRTSILAACFLCVNLCHCCHWITNYNRLIAEIWSKWLKIRIGFLLFYKAALDRDYITAAIQTCIIRQSGMFKSKHFQQFFSGAMIAGHNFWGTCSFLSSRGVATHSRWS